tara:strand:- start:281 stop:697 length:417 start_codon:yes stop_codon:yes gene_type:complete
MKELAFVSERVKQKMRRVVVDKNIEVVEYRVRKVYIPEDFHPGPHYRYPSEVTAYTLPASHPHLRSRKKDANQRDGYGLGSREKIDKEKNEYESQMFFKYSLFIWDSNRHIYIYEILHSSTNRDTASRRSRVGVSQCR